MAQKKVRDHPREERLTWVRSEEEPGPGLSRRCTLCSVSRSSLWYRPVPENEENLELMRLLDEQYTRTPFYGVRRMTEVLRLGGLAVNEKRVRRLLRAMGLEAVYPKPRLSEKAVGHEIYPYLLRGYSVTKTNQVWSSDITYIRLRQGFVYLVAVIDWYSRYVLAFEISPTMESDFCVSALEWALREGKPVIFNTDQGAQFTSEAFTSVLKSAGIVISMDGRGRALDNVFVERLWRTVKYEEVYLKEYEHAGHAREEIGRYFEFYNRERLHQALGYRTPESVFSKNGSR